jgi:hypothetical protein
MLKNSKSPANKQLKALRALPSSAPSRSSTFSSADHGVKLLRGLLIAGSIAIVLAIGLLVIDPARHLAEARDAERMDAANSLLSALYKFAADNAGRLPAGVQTAAIGSASMLGTAASGCDQTCGEVTLQAACLDLTNDLVGNYVAALPVDPKHGTFEQTGYYIERTASNVLTVGVCAPERMETIRVSR